MSTTTITVSQAKAEVARRRHNRKKGLAYGQPGFRDAASEAVRGLSKQQLQAVIGGNKLQVATVKAKGKKASGSNVIKKIAAEHATSTVGDPKDLAAQKRMGDWWAAYKECTAYFRALAESKAK